MSIATVSALMEAIDGSRLLPADQAAVLSRLQSRFTDPRALAKELLERDWLTPYQVNQLFAGRGGELVLGQYVILERLGEGGMGQVFKAQQLRMSRVVAVKLIRKDRLANQDAVKRFRREIQAAAQLTHPNVVVAYDADQVNGNHFFAMEFVEGTDLARLIRESGPLPAPFACDYIRQAALGLQHAHEKGMVHRDIKPSNLLVAWAASRKTKNGTAATSQVTGRPVIKILDMGLARFASADEDGTTSELTHEGAVMGTLDYVAPEQALNSRQADIRSDLYSLGCTFYFLLTGQVPFPGGTATEKLLKHRLDEATPVNQLRPEIPSGVAAVVRKLMAKKPEDRFQTPGELADVLSVPLASIGTGIVAPNHNGSTIAIPAPVGITATPTAPIAILVADNAGTPVAAAIPLSNNGTHLTPLPDLRRKPWSLFGWKGNLAAGLLSLGLIVALIVFLRPARKVARAPDPLPTAEKTTEADLKRLKDHLDDYTDTDAVRNYLVAVQRAKRGEPIALQAASLQELLPSPADGLSGKNLSDSDRAAAGSIDGLVAVYGDARLRQWTTSNGGGRLRGMDVSPDGKLIVTGGDDGIVRLWSASNGQPQMTMSNGGIVFWVAFGSEGKRVLAGGGFGALKQWDLQGGSVVSSPAGAVLAVSPDRRLLAIKPYDKPNQIKICQVTRGTELSIFNEHSKDVNCLAFTADGTLAASSGQDQSILVWETATGKLRHTLKGHSGPVNRLQFSSDARFLASYDGVNETLKVWQVTNDRERASIERQRQVWGMSPDGRILVVRGPDALQMKLHDTLTGNERATIRHRDGVILAMAFSPDGTILATSANAGEPVKFWDIPSGNERGQLKGQPGLVQHLKFTNDGKTLLTGNSEGTVRLWDVDTFEERRSTNNTSDWYTQAAFSRDGKTLALAGRGMVHLIDTATGKERAAMPGHNGDINALAFSPDDLTLATAGVDGNARLWDVASGQVQATLRHGGGYSIGYVGFTPDGATVVTGEGWSVRFWDTSNGVSRAVWQPPKEYVFTSYPAIAPDGKTVAVCSSAGGGIHFWDVDAGKERLPPLLMFKEATVGVNWSPDQKFLLGRAFSQGAGNIKIWDLAGKKVRATLQPSFVSALCPDSLTITLYCDDHQLRTWDTNNGQLRSTLEGHTGHVTSIVYSADGQKLATAGNDGRVILWEPLARKRKIGEAQLPGPALRLALSPDGRHVASINGNGTVYLLRLAAPPSKSGS